MRILMLGWEFPPFIAGGLGTACYGLTRALDRLGHEVIFVLPTAVERATASHVRMLSPKNVTRSGVRALLGLGSMPPAKAPGIGIERRMHRASKPAGAPGPGSGEQWRELASPYTEFDLPEFERASFHGVFANFTSPYPGFASGPVNGGIRLAWADVTNGELGITEPTQGEVGEAETLAAMLGLAPGGDSGGGGGKGGGAGPGYEGDMIQASERYARLVVALSVKEKFDVIHAHDWMTFPAGLAMAAVSGKPLVVHVHSTEFDRAGDGSNTAVCDIERRGVHGAMRIVAVSNLTKTICVKRYGVDPAKVHVVWNGIDSESAQPMPEQNIASRDKIVLFLGRITMQKGPEYFVRAAKRVLEKMQNVRFVMAGSGDMYVRVVEEAAALGIGHRFSFTGFLRGADVDRAFQMADCYVMPSVSEPFGIAPLEAMRNDVPAIISKQSGVSEALTHVLKVDFWDIDEMANMIVAVLRHPPLGDTLREHGAFELRRLTWDGAAVKCVEAYETAVSTQRARR